MSKRFVLAALIAAFVLPSMGCCFRRGCNKCNAHADAPPPPAFYTPPCPTPCP